MASSPDYSGRVFMNGRFNEKGGLRGGGSTAAAVQVTKLTLALMAGYFMS